MVMAAKSPEAPAITEGYRVTSGFDELIDAGGRQRSHWSPIISGLAELSHAQRLDRVGRINERVRETGIAHDLFADPSQNIQPWRLDLMPVAFSSAEWDRIAAAVTQRARLMEAVLADVYGRQALLRRGLIPPEVVFNDPSYLRSCHGLEPSAGRIQFFAADLARDATGDWRVTDVHSETPAGIGYALANRTVLTHVSGDIFTASRALRLAGYFQQLQEALARRVGRPDPTIALLTPGPRHNDFFSHAYLARYLGLLLVEGDDLRIDGGRIFLKTLDGLQPIDLVVRCTSGSLSDPLELEPSGFLGPVGLVRAAHHAPNAIVNMLGTAVAENRGLSAYLPALCRELLGEDLAVADTRRLWLGDPAARRQVAAQLDHYVIRRAGELTARPGQALKPRDPALMSQAEREGLTQFIEHDGSSLVAEEKTAFGTTPFYGANGLEPKPYAMRVFATAAQQDFIVMPGGLAMTVDPGASMALSSQTSATTDVWVLSESDPPPHRSLWRPTIEAAYSQREARVLPSRAADNLFWLGRYTERADWTFRVLRNCLARIEEDSGPRQSADLARMALLSMLERDAGKPSLASPPQVETSDIAALARRLATSTDHPHGLPRTLDHIHRVASLTRDRLSLEAWRTLNAFYTNLRWERGSWPSTLGETLDRIDAGLAAIAAFNGLTHENMTRNAGWRLLDMGRRLSRALNLSHFLLRAFDGRSTADEEGSRLLFLLELADSLITYRSRYRLAPLLPLVLDLLLVDETNPRSLAFQLAVLCEHIDQLPQTGQGRSRTEVQRRAMALISEIRLLEIERAVEMDGEQRRPGLTHMLRHQVEGIPLLADAITRRYFSVVEKEQTWSRAHATSTP